ncbi:MAG: CvpA family protein [Gammaproteobacteria bacterium]
MAFNWADYTLLVIISFTALLGFIRGWVHTLLSLMFWLCVFILSALFAEKLSLLLAPYIQSDSMRFAIALLCVFIISFIFITFVKALSVQFIHGPNTTKHRILGMIFGSGRGIIIVSVLLMLGTLIPLTSKAWWQQSYLIPKFESLNLWSQTLWSDTMRSAQQIDYPLSED